MFLILSCALSFFFSTAHANGPADVAKADSSLWPQAIDSKANFDQASRAEILAFAASLKDKWQSDPSAESLGIKKLELESLKQWKLQSQDYWLASFREAAKTCASVQDLGCSFKGKNFDELMAYSGEFVQSLPEKYSAWKDMSSRFYSIYSNEQMRLAALFPHPTSEILKLDPSEVSGTQFKDKQFLITLDDCPTAGGDTEKYATLLRKNSLSAFFFALGNALEEKLKKSTPAKLKTTYDHQCLASHGYEHKSHQKLAEWKESLRKTRELIRKIKPSQHIAFRPPYGRRKLELVKEQNESQAAPVVLWNIDSQDWHSKINADQVGSRVQKLMLLWRKGIILFHDVHPKALVAIPELVKFSKKAGLQWMNCQDLGN